MGNTSIYSDLTITQSLVYLFALFFIFIALLFLFNLIFRYVVNFFKKKTCKHEPIQNIGGEVYFVDGNKKTFYCKHCGNEIEVSGEKQGEKTHSN